MADKRKDSDTPPTPTRMLGKAPPRLDPRTLRLAAYLDTAKLPFAPKEVTRGDKIPQWGVMLNDQLGDCTCASPGHIIMLQTALCGDPYTPPDKNILAAYEAVGGYRPGHPETDQGANMLDLMNYWRKTGISGHKIDAFVSQRTRSHVRAAVFLFGAVNAGLSLPLTADKQFGANKTWDVTDVALTGQAAPGSWGGHSVPLVDYSPLGPVCVTWGVLHQMTWRFWDAYADEAYTPLSQDWFRDGVAPSGFNYAALVADLARLG